MQKKKKRAASGDSPPFRFPDYLANPLFLAASAGITAAAVVFAGVAAAAAHEDDDEKNYP